MFLKHSLNTRLFKQCTCCLKVWSKSGVPKLFGVWDRFCGRRFFHRQRRGWGRWFWDDSSTLHLLYTDFFLLLVHQLHLKSSGIRSQSLGIPGLNLWSAFKSYYVKLQSTCLVLMPLKFLSENIAPAELVNLPSPKVPHAFLLLYFYLYDTWNISSWQLCQQILCGSQCPVIKPYPLWHPGSYS